MVNKYNNLSKAKHLSNMQKLHESNIAKNANEEQTSVQKLEKVELNMVNRW